jgi:two-component system cell cycle response regulator
MLKSNNAYTLCELRAARCLSMSELPIRTLLIEDNFEYAQRLCLQIDHAKPGCFEFSRAGTLKDAMDCLNGEDFDIVLLDLTLPDSQGVATFIEIQKRAPNLPLVVLTSLDDLSLSVRLVQEGAQDCLVKGQTDTDRLIRAIRFALERHRMTEQLRQLSVIDELTGLLNRRGFFSLGEQQIKLAQRARRQLLLFYIDFDGLKHINDQFGHHEGDRALKKIAEMLIETFRSSDLIARLGGDEFTVLAIDAMQESAESILTRLGNQLHTANLKNPIYDLSLSLGFARFDPESAPTLENMLIEADNALYLYRRNKNNH